MRTGVRCGAALAAALVTGGCADAGRISSPAPESLFSCLYGAGLGLVPPERLRVSIIRVR